MSTQWAASEEVWKHAESAEDGGAILFFDEADSLFGKRSGVKDRHDRYTNTECLIVPVCGLLPPG